METKRKKQRKNVGKKIKEKVNWKKKNKTKEEQRYLRSQRKLRQKESTSFVTEQNP